MSLRPRSGQTYAGSDLYLYHMARQHELKKENCPSQYNLAKSESGLTSLTVPLSILHREERRQINYRLRAGCIHLFARWLPLREGRVNG
jgi:hypothetical protein